MAIKEKGFFGSTSKRTLQESLPTYVETALQSFELSGISRVNTDALYRYNDAVSTNIYKILTTENDVVSLLEDFTALGVNVHLAVEFVPFAGTNDSSFGKQWYLHGAPGINAAQAWDQIQGRELNKVSVGIIDTGFEYFHPDLQKNFKNTPGNGLHGTHVAGLLGAVTNNGK